MVPRRFSLSSLFKLQLLVLPLFLAPLYLPSHQTTHPYAYAIGLLVAPVVYVAALELLFARAAEGKWPVFTAVRRGGAFGTIFGLLAMAPGQIWTSLGPIVRWHNQFIALWSLWKPGEIAAHYAAMFLGLPAWILFVLLHYALIGAAVGGIVALVRGGRRKLVTTTARVAT